MQHNTFFGEGYNPIVYRTGLGTSVFQTRFYLNSYKPALLELTAKGVFVVGKVLIPEICLAIDGVLRPCEISVVL